MCINLSPYLNHKAILYTLYNILEICILALKSMKSSRADAQIVLVVNSLGKSIGLCKYLINHCDLMELKLTFTLKKCVKVRFKNITVVMQISWDPNLWKVRLLSRKITLCHVKLQWFCSDEVGWLFLLVAWI